MTVRQGEQVVAIVTRVVEGDLADAVETVWYLEIGDPPPRERILPLASEQIIVNLSEPYRLLGPDPVPVPSVFRTGLREKTVLIANPVPLRHVGLQLRPHGASRLGLTPAHDVRAVPGTLGDGLAARRRKWLSDRASPHDALDDMLLLLREHLRPPAPSWERADLAIRALTEDTESSIADLAAGAGVTHKTLIRDFATHVGVPPKRLAQQLRMQMLLARLAEGGPIPTWTELVADSPYVDQSHFIRSFQRFIGLTPREYRDLLAASPEGDPFFLGDRPER